MTRVGWRPLIRTLVLAAGVVLLVWAAMAQQSSPRIIRGQVLDKNGKAVASAIVHLKNLTTKEQLSVVTNKQGRYQFNEVDKKIDYQVFAEWQKEKSRARSVSQFDTRPIVVINLRLQPAKEKKEDKKN